MGSNLIKSARSLGSLGFQSPWKKQWVEKYNHHCLPKGFNHPNWVNHYSNGGGSPGGWCHVTTPCQIPGFWVLVELLPAALAKKSIVYQMYPIFFYMCVFEIYSICILIHMFLSWKNWNGTWGQPSDAKVSCYAWAGSLRYIPFLNWFSAIHRFLFNLYIFSIVSNLIRTIDLIRILIWFLINIHHKLIYFV